MTDVNNDDALLKDSLEDSLEDIHIEVVNAALEDALEGIPRYKLLLGKLLLEKIRDKDPNAVICLDRIDAAWDAAPNTPPPGMDKNGSPDSEGPG